MNIADEGVLALCSCQHISSDTASVDERVNRDDSKLLGRLFHGPDHCDSMMPMEGA